ncbi:universal stress protein [Streptomyces atratus]|uniref:universal stress protein n=1 Tax=Streptomyces atratus TaxID=1893 RepID=UPI0033F52FB9
MMPPGRHAPAGPIVVGTDGSPPAKQAVIFALREAQLRGTAVRAMTLVCEQRGREQGAALVPQDLVAAAFSGG